MEVLKEKVQFQRYPAYKDSGAEWLGEVPEEWKIFKVKNIFRLVTEPAPVNNNLELLSVYTDIGVKPRRELEERGNKASTTDGYWLVKRGDVIVNKLLAWMGAVGVSDYDGVTSPAYDILRAKIPVDSKFYHYLFRNPVCISELKKHSRGIMEMRLRLYFDKFGNILVPYPDLKQQDKIVHFLNGKCGKIDTAIAQKQQLIELLKERKQIIIQNAVTKGLDPDVKMKDSGVEWIGEIPEHWEVNRLKEVTQAYGRIGFRGYTTSDLVGEGEGAITISPSNILGDQMLFESNSFLSWEKYNESPEIQIKDQDILIVKTGSTYGKIGFVQNLPIEATINPQLLVLKNIKINNEFLFHVLRSTVIQIQIQKEVIGSTIPTISEKKILNMKVALPQPVEQERILKLIQRNSKIYDEAVFVQQQQIEKLKEYKSSLIDAAVTGKIKVS